MQLVCRYESLLRVLKLPPELVADGRNLGRAGREARVFDGVNHTRGCEKKDDHDEDGDDGPGQFHLVAAVDLRRLAAVVARALAELH